ncbi:MAG: hypothetical protein ACXVCD_05155 [Pseudobdellovibrionaceae bacterium]
MTQITFSIAQPSDAGKAANLFVIDKDTEIKAVIDLFTNPFPKGRGAYRWCVTYL